jgi:hypothetical protein
MPRIDPVRSSFETDEEDKLRRLGMSTERRIDPQTQVGQLVEPAGFPQEMHCFEGNKAECLRPHPRAGGVPTAARRDRHGRRR